MFVLPSLPIRFPYLASGLAAALSLVRPAMAADWPYWRGPNRDGTTNETGWLSEWSGEPKIAWTATVGLGFSSIVVSEGRACTVGHAEGKDTVFCFDAVTGKEIWKHSYEAELGDKFFEGGTTGTPTFDGGKVYWLSRWGDLFCFEAATGKVVWSKHLVKDTELKVPTWGFTGAPLVHEKLLVLNVGEAGTAVDKETGAIVWQSANKDNAGYSTPLPIKRGSTWLALLGSEKNYVAVEIATGKEIWRHRWVTQYGVNAADPVVQGDLAFISTGYGKGSVLLKMGEGQVEEVWKSKALRTQLNPAVFFEGHLYGPNGDTTRTEELKCLEFATDAEKWASPGFGTGGVILADKKLIALNATGELTIAPASPEKYAPTAQAQVLGGKCWTAPVLANGFIYCRNSKGEIAVVDVRGK